MEHRDTATPRAAATDSRHGPAARSGIVIPPRRPDPATAIGPRRRAPAPDHPAAVYLLSLSTRAGRESMHSALNTAARALGFTDAAEAPWGSLRYAHTAALRAILQLRYAPATANKILSAVRGTLGAAWKLGLIPGEDYRQAVSVRAVRGRDLPRGRALEAGEVRALFDVSDPERPAGARDGALLALLFGCGLRCAEAAGTRLEHLDEAAGTLRVRGKGNRERLAPVNRGALDALANWLDHRGRADGPLLRPVSRHGRIEPLGMTTAAIRLRLARCAGRAGIAHCSPHDLRRTWVSMLLDEGADITTVAKMAGHASVQTTSRYDRRDERAARTAAERLHVPVRRRAAAARPNRQGAEAGEPAA